MAGVSRFDEVGRGSPQHVDQLYRQNSLQAHLRETEILAELSTDAISKVAAATQLETFGQFQWNHDFGKVQKEDIAQRILGEPLIAEQGQPLDGLILIRNGFARLSRQHGDGHQTICLLYTSPSPRDQRGSRMPSSA